MKKVLAMLLCLAMSIACFSCFACGEDKVKFGLIALHDENSTYDANFITAFKAACKEKGVKAVIKTNIPEGQECETAADELVEDGCKLVFADSFGHEEWLLNSAKKHEDVQFCHATGTSTQNGDQANFHNAFASIYEGRYLAGYAAGLKLKAMYEKNNGLAKNNILTVGYVGAFAYAEVKSGYTSWFLGVKAAMESVTEVTVQMKVKFTNSWYDEKKEADAASALIQAGAVLVSQHADSWGAPSTCETQSVPNVSYNGSTESRCPNTYIVSSRINWQPYFEYVIDSILNGTSIVSDYVGGLGDTLYSGSVCLAQLGKLAPVEGTEDALHGVVAELKAGTRKVFDTSKFTISNLNLSAENNGYYTPSFFPALTDIQRDATGKITSAKQNGVEIIKTEGGVTYFDESANRSAPYFDIDIDGIDII